MREDKYSMEERRIIKKNTAEAVAPLLISYVSWVLRQAHKEKVRRLYFLARDGYLMHQASKILCEKLQLTIDCRYLYCSRKAFRIPEYYISGKAGIDFICRGGMNVSFRRMLERANLDVEEIHTVREQIGYQRDIDEILTYGQIQDLKGPLGHNEFLWKRISEKAEKPYRLAMYYLEQEGLLDEGVSYGIVDSGWTGSIQNSLYRLLRSVNHRETLRGYYFGLYELPQDVLLHEDNLYRSYYFSPGKNLLRKIYFNNNLFEAICSAPEGMTIGYRMEQGKIVPVFEQKENVNQEFILLTQEYLNEYLEEIEKSDTSTVDFLQLRDKEMLHVMTHPTAEEVKIYGNLWFSDDTTEKNLLPIARTLDKKQLQELTVIKRTFHLKHKSSHCAESAWPEGSICRKGHLIGWYIANEHLFKGIRYFRKQMQYKKLLRKK